MSITDIVSRIDAEIARLEQAKSLLAASETPKAGKLKKAPAARKKRRLSKEARARIAEAQRKRWAAQKKAAK
jgi:hypothetical protein